MIFQTNHYDQGLVYLMKASELVQANPEAGYPFVTNERIWRYQ
jgi:hypothetical protein